MCGQKHGSQMRPNVVIKCFIYVGKLEAALTYFNLFAFFAFPPGLRQTSSPSVQCCTLPLSFRKVARGHGRSPATLLVKVISPAARITATSRSCWSFLWAFAAFGSCVFCADRTRSSDISPKDSLKLGEFSFGSAFL